jgi:hypothetical protein
MTTIVNVSEHESPQDRAKTYAKGWTRGTIGLLIVIGLAAVGTIYLSSLVHPADLPDLGQFFGP